MLGDLIAGFCDQKCAGITEIADGLDLVVLGHERDRLADKFICLPDEIVQQIGHIERGYENIVEKLRGLGAEISKVERMPAALESAM